MHKMITLFLTGILLLGISLKLTRYAVAIDKSHENDWQQILIEELSLSSYRYLLSDRVARFDVTGSGDLQALKFTAYECDAPVYVVAMPGHEEWISLWERLATNRNINTGYVFNGVVYESYPVLQYWQHLFENHIDNYRFGTADRLSPVYALMYAKNCEQLTLNIFT